jgi:hypothetical protein
LPEYARDRQTLDAELQRLSEEGMTIPETAVLAEEVAGLERAFK